MRLRTYTGDSLSTVMAQVRRELGPDAVIISTTDSPEGGVQVRAAAERGAVQPRAETPEAALAKREKARITARGEADEGLTRIARALGWHLPPERASEALMDSAMALEDGEATATLARALDQRYGVHPLEPDPGRPVLLAGPPGSGKSSAIAKLGARAVAQGHAPVLVSADSRAGAAEQMTAYADALDLPLECVTGPRELRSVLEGLPAGPVLIDVAGLNPFDLDQLDDLAALADASDGEIVAVLDAGMTPGDAEDAAALFSSIGAGRVIATKLDIARRLGALLAFGEAGLAYAQISASPYIGDGLAPATALRLSRLLLEDPGEELPA
ncbi:MAG TPA: flagellar biosynthesis-like protein (FlhF) [Oceanicaulis sp.]|nr:flagellar biosynthesis-like protein (FlhF) [Oceanicaulis sp.]